MSSTDTQTQILAQLIMLTNQVGKLQTEVIELRHGATHNSVYTATSATGDTKKPIMEKKLKKVKPEGHVKKHPNAFLMWQNEHFRAQYKTDHPGEPAKAIATAAGPVWKAMTDQEKEPWQTKYKAAQAVYHVAVGKSDSPKNATMGCWRGCILDLVLNQDTVPDEDKKVAKKAEKRTEKDANKATDMVSKSSDDSISQDSE